MDLLESTLKVIENRNVAKESLTFSKQGLDQYEQYINQLKDNLQEIQSMSSKNTKILEINNFTKNAFNENSKENKTLFSQIYSYAQQIEKSLNAISQNESSLDDLCNENKDRLNKMETNYNNTLRLLEIMKKDLDDKILKESNDIQQEIKIKDAEQAECEEIWKNITDECEEKERTLNALKLEIEILQDNIDLEIQQQEALIQENKEQNEKKLEEISKDIELNNKILELEASILTTSQKLKDVLEEKANFVLKQNISRRNLDILEKECSSLEKEIAERENRTKQEIENLLKKTELKKKLIIENEKTLSVCQNRTLEMKKEIEQTNAKLATLDEEIEELHRKFSDEESEFLEKNNLEKLLEEHRNLVKSSEELVCKISDNKITIEKKRDEFNIVKNTPNLELIEVKEKLKTLDLEIARRTEIEKEIEEIDSNNKKLQQSVESDEQSIRDLSVQKTKLEQEMEESQKKLKALMTEGDNVEKDIRRLEVLKQEKIKLFATPPQKRARTSVQSQPAKKRGFIMDNESDSSIDGGERLSYAEFMARKKMKGNKKTKK